MCNPAIRRCLLVPAAALLTLPVFACTEASLFRGRLVVINSTGGEIRSLTVAYAYPGLNQAFDLPELADGRAWVRDCGADNLLVVGDLTVSYLDPAGTTRVHKVPFADALSNDPRDDFFIEIGRDGPPRSGPLAYRNGHARADPAPATHLLAGAAGLLLGWLLWRKGRGRAGPPGKWVTPEL